MATKQEIFEKHKGRYWKADRETKGQILSHIAAVTGMHRKATIRKLNRLQKERARRQEGRGRALYYTPDVTAALEDVWETGNEVCAELLAPMVVEYVATLLRDNMWRHGEEATGKLLSMSLATMKRRVGKFMKARRARKGLSATTPSHLKHLVPVFTGPWTDKPPGFGQIDTVLHSNSSTGDAVYSLNYTDASTLLCLPRAQWNKGQEATRASLEAINGRLPFDMLGVHPDSGSEFINYHVIDWCLGEGIELSRSRPNKKNDNMLVEERNGHVIRKEIGYVTLDCKEAVVALNEVYDVLVPYLTHFIASRRLIEKKRLGSKYRRVYEKIPKTPYQRITEHPAVSGESKKKLRVEHAKLNPLVLKRTVEKKVAALYDTQNRCGSPRAKPRVG